MKLNLGCGFKKEDGYVNVDMLAVCEPDVLHDLTVAPWPFESNSVDEIKFYYSLEQIGETPKHLISILKEMYRVLKPNGTIEIECLHPRNDRFVYNPLCIHRLSPHFFRCFSRAVNNEAIGQGNLSESYALMYNVDFELEVGRALISEQMKAGVESGAVSFEELGQRALRENNLIEAFEIRLKRL